MKIFKYETDDVLNGLNFLSYSSKKNFEYFSAKICLFDDFLITEWNNLMENGAFNYKLDDGLLTKYLNGKYGFIVQVEFFSF
jgi:hypothetical protein